MKKQAGINDCFKPHSTDKSDINFIYKVLKYILKYIEFVIFICVSYIVQIFIIAISSKLSVSPYGSLCVWWNWKIKLDLPS